MKTATFAFCLFLVLLAPSMFLSQDNLVLANAGASIPKPSVPEFTVKFVNASYSVTTTNPYTGLSETKLTSNNSIEVTIKNQPFAYSDYQIYYNVRVKPHFAENWTEIYPIQNMTSTYNGDGAFSYALYVNLDAPAQSSLSYTNITFPVVPTRVYSASGYYEGYNIQRYYSGEEGQEGRYSEFLNAIPDGAQLDFQVEALVGHSSQRWIIQHPLFPTYGGYFAPAVAYDGTSSGWSNTQTITIGANAHTATPDTSPLQSPTATSNFQSDANQQGFNWTETILLAALIVIAALLVAIALMRRKQTKK
ncbi:MAG: hypothetical protein NWE94_04330 [Candidatus Bathyarchaeota archaeon]|nr:hypothetical protein [Candidatus Bathyarchaeota archaeon]